jgi:large subunit ribosomal protein LP2
LLTAVDQTIKMKHLAAYLLLGLAGNTSPSDSDIKGVLQSVGIDADEERLEKLLSELKGKDINEVCWTIPLCKT